MTVAYTYDCRTLLMTSHGTSRWDKPPLGYMSLDEWKGLPKLDNVDNGYGMLFMNVHVCINTFRISNAAL